MVYPSQNPQRFWSRCRAHNVSSAQDAQQHLVMAILKGEINRKLEISPTQLGQIQQQNSATWHESIKQQNRDLTNQIDDENRRKPIGFLRKTNHQKLRIAYSPKQNRRFLIVLGHHRTYFSGPRFFRMFPPRELTSCAYREQVAYDHYSLLLKSNTANNTTHKPFFRNLFTLELICWCFFLEGYQRNMLGSGNEIGPNPYGITGRPTVAPRAASRGPTNTTDTPMPAGTPWGSSCDLVSAQNFYSWVGAVLPCTDEGQVHLALEFTSKLHPSFLPVIVMLEG